ncbi:AIM24 family protein [Streptomyces sp. 8K308]|uniref:AIM24 family protein n=1 Tax=Streptomyces sp. 8K308 TaxID=2530388 RepID=UPI001047E70A|nr:AIM24 family protein [Streptomyces sp. 8K308]TDC23669.1 AIM24 family protein [Streptomyces sp. 8K308]
MQSPIFNHTVNQTEEHFAAQGAHMLRVNLSRGMDVLARTGSMVAFEGMVEFDAEHQSARQQRSQWATGEVLPLMRCFGQGAVYLANLAQYVHVLDIDHEGLTVDSSYVLALDAHLHWDVVAVESQYGIPGAGAYNLVIAGQGKVAITTSGFPLVMRVSPERYVSADADAVVAWSSSLRVQAQAQTSNRSLWSRRGNTGEGWELSFMGDGHVVVQPSELMPPLNTSFGEQLGGQFRQDGTPGMHQGGAWGPR